MWNIGVLYNRASYGVLGQISCVIPGLLDYFRRRIARTQAAHTRTYSHVQWIMLVYRRCRLRAVSAHFPRRVCRELWILPSVVYINRCFCLRFCRAWLGLRLCYNPTLTSIKYKRWVEFSFSSCKYEHIYILCVCVCVCTRNSWNTNK